VAEPTAVFDPQCSRMVVFGGTQDVDCSFGGCPRHRETPLNTTYALSLTGSPTVTDVSTSGTLPLGRGHHTAVLDPCSNMLITFGGGSYSTPLCAETYLNDTWALTLPDVTPPASVTDLAVKCATEVSINLKWTARGDDGQSCRAAAYDLRYSTSLINEANFSSGTQATTSTPGSPGSQQFALVSNLTPCTQYYFAIKVRDDHFNWSTISNVISPWTMCLHCDCATGICDESSSATAVFLPSIIRRQSPGDHGVRHSRQARQDPAQGKRPAGSLCCQVGSADG